MTMMTGAEIALTVFAVVVLGCLLAGLVWMVAWTMEDEDDG
jgi:hypothetical protein